MQSVATGFLGIGLVVTCLAGFRVLLFGVDMIAGTRRRSALRPADIILLVIALAGVAMLLLGIALLHGGTPPA